jgi:glutamate N-acetyltransferase/amino-acid N-acetyltransferase
MAKVEEEAMQQLANGSLSSPQGFHVTAVSAHIKYPNRPDLALIVSEQDCAAAGLFTTNQVAAAPVIVDRQTLRTNDSHIRAVLINSGNANAATGQIGLDNARTTQQLVATAVGCAADEVLVLSTGVIGVQLPMEKMTDGIRAAAPHLSPNNGVAAAYAIMTTDTRPKHTAVTLTLSGGPVTIGGMAKGAGMIHPNMATMLAALTTDAQIAPELLQTMLATAVNLSFNRISIDGDTSTNDTILLLANGVSGTAVANPTDQAIFQNALNHICTQLAQMIVRDGEGATKFVEIQVSGTATDTDAHTIANTIATSPLVKTAFAGSDANWGRILAAAGRAGVPFDQNQTDLWVSAPERPALQLVQGGTPTAYLEIEAAAIFAETDILVQLTVGIGAGRATVWTCDLSHEYVSINADYRT